MTEESELQSIIELASQGKKTEARDIILELEPRIKRPLLRIKFIDISLSVLNDVKDNEIKTALSIEGEKIARITRQPDLQAHFMAKTSELIILQVTTLHHRKLMLKLAPGWFQFATEEDNKEYDLLEESIIAYEKRISSLLSRAIELSEGSGNNKIRASVLMSVGATTSAKYIRHKMVSMNRAQAKIINKFAYFQHPKLYNLITLWNGESKILNDLLKKFIDSYLKAASICEEIDDPLAGYAYYNLAVHLRSTYQFCLVRRYLKKAREIALIHNDAGLMHSINDLEKIIKEKKGATD